MSDEHYNLTDLKSDVKHLVSTVDEIRDKLSEHDKRLNALEMKNERKDAAEEALKTERKQDYNRLKMYYFISMIIFTVVNIGTGLYIRFR